jgi:hypothetical protein
MTPTTNINPRTLAWAGRNSCLSLDAVHFPNRISID